MINSLFVRSGFSLVPSVVNFYQRKSLADIQGISILVRKTVFVSANKNEATAFLGFGIIVLKYI